MEKKEVFVTYTNTDCTEGRGADVPIAVCKLEATAIRLGRKRYVQGSDGPIRKAELIELDGKWYYPSQAVYVVPPTKEDLASQKVMDDRRAVIDKARAAGLTDDDLRMLGGGR